MISEHLQTYSFEYLMERALSKVPNNIDKREGSIIYDALAPCILEISLFYNELIQQELNISYKSAVGKSLTLIAEQKGVFRKSATRAIRKGEFNTSVPIGSRFSIESINYEVIGQINETDFELRCEQRGEIGNEPYGALLPVTYLSGITKAELTDILIAGTNEESDDMLRERFRQSIILSPEGGNIAQYLQWAQEYRGIGTAKVFPLWDGGNTVKVAITNGLFLPAEQPLVDAFQEYIDPNVEGLGNGKAPIGAKVTISGGTQKDIDIYAKVVLNEGFSEVENAEEEISTYLASIVYNKNTVSYMRIGSVLLDVNSIAEIIELELNGGIGDVSLIDDEIPVLNTLDFEVV